MNDETLEYALHKLEKQNDDILSELHDLKDNLPNMYISKEVHRVELNDLERRVGILECSSSKVTWAILSAIGSILLTILSSVVKF